MFFYLFPCHKNFIVLRESTWWSHNFCHGIADRGDSLIIQSWLNFVLTLPKKWSFPLRISSVNVTKSAVSCGFGHIYWKNPQWKTSFFVQCKSLSPEVATGGGLLEKMFFKISQNSQKNTCVIVFFLDKVAGLMSASLLKRRHWHRCFPVNFAKIPRTPLCRTSLGDCFGKSLCPT